MKKPLPKLESDREAEDFLEKDLTDFLSPENFQKMTFEFEPKNKKITLRMSDNLYNALKQIADKRGMNYQKVIREALEKYIHVG